MLDKDKKNKEVTWDFKWLITKIIFWGWVVFVPIGSMFAKNMSFDRFLIMWILTSSLLFLILMFSEIILRGILRFILDIFKGKENTKN